MLISASFAALVMIALTTAYFVAWALTQIGMAGIDVHRGHVNLNLRRDFFQIEAADAASGEAHAGFELHRNPF